MQLETVVLVMDKLINLIELGLLLDLIGLYTSDLETETHMPGHIDCLACSKEDILRSMSNYRRLDSLYRNRFEHPPAP